MTAAESILKPVFIHLEMVMRAAAGRATSSTARSCDVGPATIVVRSVVRLPGCALRPCRPEATRCLETDAAANVHRAPHASVPGQEAERDDHVAERHRGKDERRPAVDPRER